MLDPPSKGDGARGGAGGRVERLIKARHRAPSPQHKYNVGDSVTFTPERYHTILGPQELSGQTTGFKILSRLPMAGRAFQYRIKNDVDGHERVVVETQISPPERSLTEDTLTEDTPAEDTRARPP
jgi:hypothetical protein